MIDQYQDTPGSDGLKFESNPDIHLGHSAVCLETSLQSDIHLSTVDLYNRGGSAGSIDSKLDAARMGIIQQRTGECQRRRIQMITTGMASMVGDGSLLMPS